MYGIGNRHRSATGSRLLFFRAMSGKLSHLPPKTFVVALQQEEGLGVASDDIHQPPTLVGRKRFASGRALHEPQRGLQLPGVLLQALAV